MIRERLMTEHKAATDRCRRAFLMNAIPWDYKLTALPTYVLEKVADCWERRAHGLPVDEYCLETGPDRMTLKAAKKVLEEASPARAVNGPVRYGHAVFNRQQRQYHGDGGSYRYDE